MFKTIKNKLSWKTLEKDMSLLIARFPISVIAIFVLFGISTILLQLGFDEVDFEYTILVKSLMTALFVALLAYAIALGEESWGIVKKSWKVATSLAVLVCAVLYYFYIPTNLDSVPFEVIFTLFSVLGLVFVASFSARFEKQYFTKKYTDTPFYLFVIAQLIAMLEGFFVAIFVFVLGAATLGSIDALFSLSIPGEWYAQWWIVAATLIGPLYFLSHVPEHIDEQKMKLESFGKFLRFVIVYAALPFIGIYLVILYAYSIKVLTNFSQWPEGIVAWLVILFSFFGFIVYFLSYHVRTERTVSIFRRWFPYILAPQLAMLFYAIGLRIAQHGVTINRYLVVVFGIWIGFLCAYYIFSKAKTLFILPASLFLGLVLVLIGPWGVFAVSENSQVSKLESLFEKHGILENDTIVLLDEADIKEIPDNDKEAMISTTRYVCENHGCASLSEIFGDQYQKAIDEETRYYSQYSNLLKYVGLPTYVNQYNDSSRDRFVSWYAEQSKFTINATGVQSVTFVESYDSDKNSFGVKTGDTVVVYYTHNGTTKSEDITVQFTELLLNQRASDNKFAEGVTREPFEIVFTGGTFFVIQANAQLEDEQVKEFTNTRGYIVVNE